MIFFQQICYIYSDNFTIVQKQIQPLEFLLVKSILFFMSWGFLFYNPYPVLLKVTNFQCNAVCSNWSCYYCKKVAKGFKF